MSTDPRDPDANGAPAPDTVTIHPLSTAHFHALVHRLEEDGWTRTSEYDGMDAWIDYGCIVLARGDVTLTCEWDNWSEGSIEGPRPELERIAAANGGLPVTRGSRWDESR